MSGALLSSAWARAEGVSFRHAVELLRDGMPAISPGVQGRSGRRCPGSPRRWTGPRLTMSCWDQVTDYYHRVLPESLDALGYLA